MKTILSLLSAGFALLYTTVQAQVGTINTVAGGSIQGFSGDGSQAVLAELNEPEGVALDAAGNIYIADANNHRIRKINLSGIITTVAGNGIAGNSGDGGPATSAKLGFPDAVAVDAAGNLYIADETSACIRKVDTAGIITTVAGNGITGYSGDGGLATSASLHTPSGVAIDALGNIYIADADNNRVRMIDTSGIIITVAGNGTTSFSGDGGQANIASLYHPTGITLDGVGNLYIAAWGNNRIRKVNTSGIINTIVGNGTGGFAGDGGQALAAELYNPFSVTVDASGNLFIADFSNNRIRKVDTAGIITTVAGNGTQGFSGDGGQAVLAALYHPGQVAFDATGNMYIADYINNRVRKVVFCPLNTLTITGNDSICSGDSTVLHANGGTNYVWSSNAGSATTDSVVVSPANTTVYSIVSSDSGCTYSANFTVNVNPILTISGTSTICPGANAVLMANGAASYLWSSNAGSATTDSVTVLPNVTTTYSVTGTMGVCSATQTFVVNVDSLSPITFSEFPTNNFTICAGGGDSLVASGAFQSFNWMPGNINSASIPAPSSNTTYTVTAVNQNGCIRTDSVAIAIGTGCVWPGDANEDLVDDHFDVFQIGLNFGEHGPARATQDSTWKGFFCADWNDTLPNGKNAKYADCNGDSTIDHKDVRVIAWNMHLTHAAKSGGVPHIYTANPDVYLHFDKTSYNAGDSVVADVMLGTAANPQVNFYGAGFTINYDISLVQPGSEQFYFVNSWVGTNNQDVASVNKIFSPSGEIDAALVRTTHTDISGQGKIATLKFALNNTIADTQLFVTISSVQKIDSAALSSQLASGTDSVALVPGTILNATVMAINNRLIAYPNPGNGNFTIQSEKELGTVTVLNVLGEVIFSEKTSKTKLQVDLSKQADGMYFIQSQGKNIRIVKN